MQTVGGINCEIQGESNSELPAPLMTFLTGEAILPVWPEIARLLKKAAAWGRGDYEAEDILVLTMAGRMQVWTFSQEEKIFLAGATRITEHPRRKVCELYALAGYRMVEMWGQFSHVLQTWCEANGVTDIETTCRPEISAKIQPLGFVPTVQVLRLDRKELK